jgi:hypothetical protein
MASIVSCGTARPARTTSNASMNKVSPCSAEGLERFRKLRAVIDLQPSEVPSVSNAIDLPLPGSANRT